MSNHIVRTSKGLARACMILSALSAVAIPAVAEPPPFREAVRVGDLLILSGQIGIDHATGKLVDGGTVGEARQTMDNIGDTLARNGLTFADIVQCRVFLENMREWQNFNKVYVSFFTDGNYPARSALGANGLALGAKVEVECTAAYPAMPLRHFGAMVGGAPYSQAVLSGGHLYVSGVVPYNMEAARFADADMGSQMAQALANLDAVLAKTGVKRTDIVSATIFMKDPKEKSMLDQAWTAYFAGADLPARTLVPGADWGRDDLRVEISVVAKATAR